MEEFILEGDFGAAAFGSNGTTNTLTLTTESSLTFFRSLALRKERIEDNALGLYTFARGVRKEAKFMSMSTPRHLLRARSNAGCTWNPSKNRLSTDVSKISLCPVEVQLEECPDYFWDTCFEQLFYNGGNGIRDIMQTQAGRRLFAELMANVYRGLGNSYFDLTYFGQNPLIDVADAQDTYGVDDEEWANYKQQQDACVGVITLMDMLKEEGHANYNVPIYDNEVSDDRAEFIGSAQAFFNRMIAAQPREMADLASSRYIKGIFLVDPRIFYAYENELLTKFSTLPDTLYYTLNGEFCASNGCTAGTVLPNVLKYKGYWVVNRQSFGDFNTMVGIDTMRAALVTPGVLGMAYDVTNLQQFNGMGLQMVQHKTAPHMGKIYMNTNFETGAGIINRNLVVYASKTMIDG